MIDKQVLDDILDLPVEDALAPGRYLIERDDVERILTAALAASATDEHTHRIEYPSACTGCEHLAAAFVANAPEWMRGRPAVPEALQERLTREGTVEAIEEAANAAAKAYADHGLSSDPFHAIVMPLRRALGYLARPAVPETLDVEPDGEGGYFVPTRVHHQPSGVVVLKGHPQLGGRYCLTDGGDWPCAAVREYASAPLTEGVCQHPDCGLPKRLHGAPPGEPPNPTRSTHRFLAPLTERVPETLDVEAIAVYFENRLIPGVTYSREHIVGAIREYALRSKGADR
jgi:hypothetical protein